MNDMKIFSIGKITNSDETVCIKLDSKYADDALLEATEGLYSFFFQQTDSLGIDREIANHLLRIYKAFLEGFIMLQIHNAFGNPISIDESFEVSMNVLKVGLKQYCR